VDLDRITPQGRQDGPAIPRPPARTHVGEPRFLAVLDEVLDVLRTSEVTALVIGGVAAAIFGRPRWSDDVDLFVRAEDALPLLRALAGRGFDTDETFPDWLYKAFKDGVLIDLIFKSAGDIYLDDEMVERSCAETFRGRSIPVVAPEDLVVMKAIAHSEPTARYWYDALGILSRVELDWEYLLRRARQGPHRVLSLLVYARSNDIAVPDAAIDRLLASTRGSANGGPAHPEEPSTPRGS
jgi:predicted nucleotidyltransferase